MKTKIQIKSMFGKLLFEYETENNTVAKTLEQAAKEGANLQFANLKSADLRCANLQFARLESANLQFANLESANLQFARLEFANLESANLKSANLESANLQFANLESANLRGAIKLPIYCKWSIGITNNQIHIGCEKRTIEEWDLFFASEKVISTERDTPEFKQIKAAYEGYKAYYLALQ
jgi:hypothetical protein